MTLNKFLFSVMTLNLKAEAIILGMNVGFGLKMAKLPSSLIRRQDGETKHKLLTLLALCRVQKNTV